MLFSQSFIFDALGNCLETPNTERKEKADKEEVKGGGKKGGLIDAF